MRMSGDEQSALQGAKCPRHVAIIMDGNGRWASRRRLPRFAGHKAGVETVKGVVRACGEKGIEVLTLFAFSSENWRRPQEEVGLLMGLFMTALEQVGQAFLLWSFAPGIFSLPICPGIPYAPARWTSCMRSWPGNGARLPLVSGMLRPANSRPARS